MKTVLFLGMALCFFQGLPLCSAQHYAHQVNNTSFGRSAPNKVPIYAGLGAVILGGTGLMVAGLTKRADALDSKTLFNTYTDPNDPFYIGLGLTRDEFQDSYKSDLKKSNILTFAGAGVVVVGVGILINRIIWLKRIERSNARRSGFLPNRKTPPFTVTCKVDAHAASAGWIYHF